MPYVPPHLRDASTGASAAPSSGSSLEVLLASQERSGSRGKGGKGSDRPRKDGRGGYRAGPCAIMPTQMTLHRRCACSLDEVTEGSSLIGTAAEFCDAFYHVRETPEGGLPLCCLRHPAECEGRNTVIVARLDDGIEARPRLVARFHNKDKNHHAERVMMEDRKLLASLRLLSQGGGDGGGEAAAAVTEGKNGGDGGNGGGIDSVAKGEACQASGSGARLRVYISLQPCHHSSSMVHISCTRDLIAFHERELLPRGVELELVVAYPYRSHWEPEHMSRAELIELGARTLFGPRYHSKGNKQDLESVVAAVDRIAPDAADRAVETAHQLMRSAREGTALLVSGAPPLFSTRAMGAADWDWLVGLADGSVQDAWRSPASAGTSTHYFTSARQAVRRAADAWTASLFDRYRCHDADPE